MKKREQAFYDELLPRISAYRKPSHEQRQIIALSQNNNRTEIQERQLVTLIQVQMKAHELRQARLKASAIDKEKRQQERKKETRRKIIWGGALKQASKSDPEIARIMCRLYDNGYISDKDRAVIAEDYDTAKRDTNMVTISV